MVPKCCQTNKFADSSLDFKYRDRKNEEITITCKNQRSLRSSKEKQILQSSISDNKLSEKKNTAFKNNAIVYKMKVLDSKDPLNQMMLLNDHKTFLLNKRLIQLKGIKCNEILEVYFEKLGVGGKMIEKPFVFTSPPRVIMHKNDIESALQNMRSDI